MEGMRRIGPGPLVRGGAHWNGQIPRQTKLVIMIY